VIPVGVVQMAIDQVVNMVPVRDRLVAATGAMAMFGGVLAALMVGGAAVGVLIVDREHMFVDVILMGMMEVAIVEVICVSLVLDSCVSAVGAVNVPVFLVFGAVVHCRSFVEVSEIEDNRAGITSQGNRVQTGPGRERTCGTGQGLAGLVVRNTGGGGREPPSLTPPLRREIPSVETGRGESAMTCPVDNPRERFQPARRMLGLGKVEAAGVEQFPQRDLPMRRLDHRRPRVE
jgi:hypothetical protein